MPKIAGRRPPVAGTVLWHVSMSLDGCGAAIPRQALELGLLDEIQVHVAPLLMGSGVRLYGNPAAPPVHLERLEIAASDDVADLRYRVPRPDHG